MDLLTYSLLILPPSLSQYMHDRVTDKNNRPSNLAFRLAVQVSCQRVSSAGVFKMPGFAWLYIPRANLSPHRNTYHIVYR